MCIILKEFRYWPNWCWASLFLNVSSRCIRTWRRWSRAACGCRRASGRRPAKCCSVACSATPRRRRPAAPISNSRRRSWPRNCSASTGWWRAGPWTRSATCGTWSAATSRPNCAALPFCATNRPSFVCPGWFTSLVSNFKKLELIC